MHHSGIPLVALYLLTLLLGVCALAPLTHAEGGPPQGNTMVTVQGPDGGTFDANSYADPEVYYEGVEIGGIGMVYVRKRDWAALNTLAAQPGVTFTIERPVPTEPTTFERLVVNTDTPEQVHRTDLGTTAPSPPDQDLTSPSSLFEDERCTGTRLALLRLPRSYCETQCKADPACAGWTYAPPSGEIGAGERGAAGPGECYLFSDIDLRVDGYPGAVCGVVRPQRVRLTGSGPTSTPTPDAGSTARSTLFEGERCSGRGLETVEAARPRCQSLCENDEMCAGWNHDTLDGQCDLLFRIYTKEPGNTTSVCGVVRWDQVSLQD